MSSTKTINIMKTLVSLFFSLLMMMSMSAQVGVNNPNPEQALDVNGKLKITNDSNVPTAGTMRYNENSNEFEGHNGTDWNSFTSRANGPLPSSAIPVFAFENIISAGTSISIVFRDWDGTVYSTIPAGKMIIVTGFYPSPNSAAIGNFYYAFSFSVRQGGNLVTGTALRLSGYENETNPLTGDLSPLMVIKSGQTLEAFSYNSSEAAMSLSVRGFLVDDINY